MVENFTKPKSVGEALERAAAKEKGLTDWLVTRDGRQVISVEDKGPSFTYRYRVTTKGRTFKVADNGKYILDEDRIDEEKPCDIDILLTIPECHSEPESLPEPKPTEPTTVAEALAAGRCGLLVDGSGKQLESIIARTGLAHQAYPYVVYMKYKERRTYTPDGKYVAGCSGIRDLQFVPAEPEAQPEPEAEPQEVDDMPELAEIPADQWFPDKLVTSHGNPVHSCGFIGDENDWRWVILSAGGSPYLCDRYGKVIEGWSVLLKPAEPYDQIMTAMRKHSSMSDRWYIFEYDKGTPLPKPGKKYRITEVVDTEGSKS